jgi:hypothetical protein
MRLPWRVSLLLFAVVAAQGSANSSSAAEESPSVSDEILLNYFRVAEFDTADGLFLTDNPRELRALVLRAGGVVVSSSDEIGYLRARLPAEHYPGLAASSSVIVSRLNGPPVPWTDLWTANEEERGGSVPESDRRNLITQFSRLGPVIVPSAFVGVPEFQKTHPTFDGRGTGIAILEEPADFTNPDLQVALDMYGESIPKISVVMSYRDFAVASDPAVRAFPHVFDPADESPRASAVQHSVDMRIVTDKDGSFAVNRRTCRAPFAGEFFLSSLRIDSWLHPLPDSEGVRAVLWVPKRAHAWMDVQGTCDFRGALALSDFNYSRQVEHLHIEGLSADTERGAEEKAEIAFVVSFDRDTGRPQVWRGDFPHSTMVAGMAAGGGFARSAAPNAQLAYIGGDSGILARTSDTLEGALLAASRGDVDVLSSSTLADDIGRSSSAFVPVFLNRVIERYGKAVFWGAGNDLGLSGTTQGASNASRVLSVGAYANAETIGSLTGYKLRGVDWVMNYSRGPAPDGAMKPDLIAPSYGVALSSCTAHSEEAQPAAVKFPRCFGVGLGTSAAAPTAASAAAALISGAKQVGIPHDAARIEWALRAGARFLKDWPAHSQGAGLINLPRAWELLSKAAHWPEYRYAPQIEVRAPVRNLWFSIITQRTATQGVGLYEREGWTPDQTGVRRLMLTRTVGPSAPVHYKLCWLGNDHTFRLQMAPGEGVDLPLNQPTPIEVIVHPRTYGIHSAILELLDDDSGAPVQWVLNTIVAAYGLEEHSAFSASARGVRDFLGVRSIFVDVPAGARALAVSFQNGSGHLAFVTQPPLDVGPLEGVVSNSSYSESAAWHDIPVGSSAIRLFPSPAQGVWQFVAFDPGNPLTTMVKPSANHFSVQFAALAADVTADREAPDQLRLNITNRMADLRRAAAAVELGALQSRSLTTRGIPAVNEILVRAGVSTLTVKVRSVDGRTPLKMYLYDCSERMKGDCKLWDVPLTKLESAVIRDPDSGRWKVIVEPATKSADIPYELQTIQTGPRYGMARATGLPHRRASGTSWSEIVRYSLNRDAYVQGETPIALVELRDLGSEFGEQESLKRVSPQRPIAIGDAVVRLSTP